MLKKILLIPTFLLLLSCNFGKQNNLESKIDTSLLYGVWAFDISDPHADFMINEDEYYIVDYDGDGSLDYTLKGNELTISNDSFTQSGKITSLTTDSLKIKWIDTDIETKYVRFPKD